MNDELDEYIKELHELERKRYQASYGGFPYNYGLPKWDTSDDEDEKKDKVGAEKEKKEECDHEWKTVQLIISSVEVCKKCGIKKEDK